MKKLRVCMAVPNPFTHDQRVYREAKTLVDNGYSVTVVALKEFGSTITDEEVLDGIKVLRISKERVANLRGTQLLTEKIGVLPKILLYGNSFTPQLQRALSEQKADIYHAHDLDTLQASYQASRENKAKIVYDSHEIFLEALKEWQAEIRENGDLIKLVGAYLVSVSLSRIEKNLIEKVDKVITINDSIASFLTKKYHLNEKPTVVMNCYELTEVGPNDKLRLKFSLPESTKVIIFQGAFGKVRGLDNTIKAVQKVENAALILMGEGNIKTDLEALVRKLGLEKRVFFHPTVAPKELLNYTSSADLGVIAYRNTSLNNYFCTPNKIFEYMMAGIPMVVSDFPELKKFAALGAGLTFDPESPNSIATTINKVFSGNLVGMKEKARSLAEESYNWEVESKKLLQVYSSLN